MMFEKFYDKVVPYYNFIYSHWLFGPARKEAVRMLQTDHPKKILECGVGTGLTLPYYDSSVQVMGIDVAEKMIQESQRVIKEKNLGNCQVQVMNATELKFADNEFDGVLANLFMSATSDPEGALSEMIRVCKPGGSIVFMNHFLSENPAIRLFENALNPLTVSLTGFNLVLDLKKISAHTELELMEKKKVSRPLWFWTAVRFKNKKISGLLKTSQPSQNRQQKQAEKSN